MEGRQILRGTIIVSVLTQLSRVLGFVREMITSRLLGDGFLADSYFVASRIPNLLRAFFAEGALTSAFVPLFAGSLEKSREEASKALSICAGFLFQTTIAISLLGIFYSPEIAELFAPGFSQEKVAYTAMLTRIMLPFLTLISIVSALNGALTSIKVFGSASWVQVIINLALILGGAIGYFTETSEVPVILAWSVLAGGLIGIFTQIKPLKRNGINFTLNFSLKNHYIKELVVLMIPALLGAALYQLTIFISGVLASLLEEGSVSWIYYADRLAQLPIGIITVALGSVLLPSLSRAHIRSETSVFHNQLEQALRFTGALIIPISAFLFTFSESLVSLFLEGGRFNAYASHQSAVALQAFSIGLWGVSCQSIAIKAFIARKDTITPSILSGVSLVGCTVLGLLFMGEPKTMHADFTSSMVIIAQKYLFMIFPHINLGHAGLALSSGMGTTISFLLLGILLIVRIKFLLWRRILISHVKALSGSIAASLLVIYLFPEHSLSPIKSLLFGGSLFCLMILLIALLVRSEELKVGVKLLQERGKR